jgi:hypothetical protein
MQALNKSSMRYLFAGFAVLVLALVLLVVLSTPQDWPMTPGSVKVSKVRIGTEDFALIQGDPINCLGQIQGIAVSYDFEKQKIIVKRYIIRWHPFTRLSVNNQWPVLYPLSWLPPGKYEVLYQTEKAMDVADSVTVEAASK